jgi:hypothetical protein
VAGRGSGWRSWATGGRATPADDADLAVMASLVKTVGNVDFTPDGSLNSAGLIAGLATQGESVVYDSGAKKFIPVPTTMPVSYAEDVNENGLVVGAQYGDLGASTPGRAYTYAVSTKKFTRLPGLYHFERQTVSKTGIVVETAATGQPVVVNDCVGTPYTPLGLASDPKLGGAYGADAKGAIWAWYGNQTVRWLRTPGCT